MPCRYRGIHQECRPVSRLGQLRGGQRTGHRRWRRQSTRRIAPWRWSQCRARETVRESVERMRALLCSLDRRGSSVVFDLESRRFRLDRQVGTRNHGRRYGTSTPRTPGACSFPTRIQWSTPPDCDHSWTIAPTEAIGRVAANGSLAASRRQYRCSRPDSVSVSIPPASPDAFFSGWFDSFPVGGLSSRCAKVTQICGFRCRGDRRPSLWAGHVDWQLGRACVEAVLARGPCYASRMHVPSASWFGPSTRDAPPDR